MSAPEAKRDLAAVHRRFARAALVLYLAAAAVGVALLLAMLLSDLSFQQAGARSALRFDAETRAHWLGRELGLLSAELRRLGMRSEIDLLDQNLAPEQSLLRLSHEQSAFFNVGVAIVGRAGQTLWSLPADFLPVGRDLADQPWFQTVLQTREVAILPVAPGSGTARQALLYLVSPVVRGGDFSGALVGGVDLAAWRGLAPEEKRAPHSQTLLVTRDGRVVYPVHAPAYTADPVWPAAVAFTGLGPFLARPRLAGRGYVIGGDAVPATDLLLLEVIPTAALAAPAHARLVTRLAVSAALVFAPLALFVLLFRRTLRAFLDAQRQAARDERLRLLGEASNLIAHEIKNSLNGLQVGLALERSPRTLAAMRSEITRLADLTTKLLSFSKGVTPRPAPLDLGSFVRKLAPLFEESCAEAGVKLELVSGDDPIPVRADASLVHVVLSNLVANAIDALAGRGGGTLRLATGASADRAWVSVEDDGPGVAAHVRAKLFDPFVTGKPSGTGIGLALSRKIALAHGGDLALEDSAEGARFVMTLPVTKP